jgi:hypothetical protein
MRHPCNYLWLAVLGAAATVALGDEEKTPPSADKEDEGEVLVQLANGSSVRLAVLHERIDVVTRYGTLSVPLKDVQKIDFGVRLPPGVERKVEAAIAKLGSAQYGERDTGERELAALGAQAYPALKRAVKHMDKEVSRRAARTLAALRERLPDKDLRDREEDVISTPGFTILGKIAPATLKVSSEYFGTAQIHLAQIRQLRTLKTAGEADLAIDAAKWGSVHGQWLDTGYQCDAALTLAIKASGTVDLFPQTPGQYMSTPNGMQAANGAAFVRGGQIIVNPRNMQNLAGALLGRVGENGSPFLIGDSYEGNPGEGKLYLHIVPSPWNNASSGSYQVKISPKQ